VAKAIAINIFRNVNFKLNNNNMNPKKITLALLVVIFSFSANAQLFWRVSGNGLTKPSCLFGTHHLIE